MTIMCKCGICPSVLLVSFGAEPLCVCVCVCSLVYSPVMDQSPQGHVSISSASCGDPNHAGLSVVSHMAVQLVLNLKTEQLKVTSSVCSIMHTGPTASQKQWDMVFNIILCGGPAPKRKRRNAAGTTAAGPASTPASTPPGTL